MEIHEIVSRLVGPIRGIGESNSDEKRLENMKEFIKLHEEMTMQLIAIARDSENYQSSVKVIGLQAKNHLDYLKSEFEAIDAPF